MKPPSTLARVLRTLRARPTLGRAAITGNPYDFEAFDRSARGKGRGRRYRP
jgi:hypothetical protein